MRSSLSRRHFLSNSAVLGGSMLTCGFALDRSANAAPVRVDAPVVEQVTVREITDNSHDIFLRGAKLPGLAVGRTGMPDASKGAVSRSPRNSQIRWSCRVTGSRKRTAPLLRDMSIER
jgi:hypothetical protein